MIKTRFSPSPTGMIQLGNVRTALFSALFAKKEHGKFLLRIEDTDQSRSQSAFVDSLENDLTWLGLNWQEGPVVGGDNGPYFQSERGEIYNKFYDTLEKNKTAYPCFCTEQELALHRKLQLSRSIAPRYSGKCRNLTDDEVQQKLQEGKKPTLRFKVPEGEVIEFVDLIKGKQTFQSHDIGDFIIRRADKTASFFFCNSVDDSLMGVTHVLRGDDHLTNTPRQILILNSLSLQLPQYGHMPLIMGSDGAKLSKRNGSFSLSDLTSEGYLAVAIINYLARLSHSYDCNNLMSFDELAKDFDLNRVSSAAAKFDLHQLQHWQKEAVLSIKQTSIWKWLGESLMSSVPEDKQDLFANLMRQNITLPTEAAAWQKVFFADDFTLDKDAIEIISKTPEKFFEVAIEAAKDYGSDIKAIINHIKTKLEISGKKLFMPVRVSLTGKVHGPELDNIAKLLGPELIANRFTNALRRIQHATNLQQHQPQERRV